MSDSCTLQNHYVTVEISPLGAEMQSLCNAAGDDFLWHGDPEHWGGRAPVLFPIVGRAADDTIAIGDHSAQMKQHGFARRSVFELEAQTQTSCTYILAETPESLEIYPFSFALRLTYALEGASVHVTAKVTNKSDIPMPFGLGFHPAFVWPLPNAAHKPHHVTLKSEAEPARKGLEGGLLRHEALPSSFVRGDLEIREELFAHDALVFPNASEPLRYGPKEGPALEFQFHNLPDLALWKPINAPFLCIEPWHGTASYIGDGPQISNRPNSVSLPAGESMSFGYDVTICDA